MQYLKGLSTLKIDAQKCAGCRVCLDVCPHAVIEMADGRAFVKTLDSCMECGACKMNCRFGAIEVSQGVGCAQAIIKSMITGKEPTCGCSCNSGNDACC